MASTFVLPKSSASLVKLLSPPPFLLLLLLLPLSFLLALSLLHINDLLTHSLSSPPLMLHHLSPPLLLVDKQALLPHLLHNHHYYLGLLLSPPSIFILANLIIFTLLIKGVYFSSPVSDLSDFVSEKSEYGDASLPGQAPPSQDYFFLSTPPYQQFVVSHDPCEEYHVLSFTANYDEPKYCNTVKSYNKLGNTWEKVKRVGVDPYISSNISNGAIAQKEVKRPSDKMMVGVGKTQSVLTVVPTPAYNMLNVQEQVKVEGKNCTPTKAAMYASPGSQAVVINMELPPARRDRNPTSTSMQSSHPPVTSLAPLQCAATKAAPLSPMPVQRPPSSPQVKKSLQSTGSSANDGRYAEASKPIANSEKQALKSSKPQRKASSMVRSHSEQRLSHQDPSTEVSTVLTSPSSLTTNRPHMQRAQSLRSSSNVITTSTHKPHMQRAQSMRSPDAPNASSHVQVTRTPSFSASLDELSDADANKCFSDFIAHRFALMKKELDSST